MRARVPLVKMVASAVTIGTGGSGGREGSIAQIGAGFGAYLATRLKLSARDRRVLLAVGMGAGVGAIFRGPLAGALFAAEILYSETEFEAEVVVPAAVATIISYCVYVYSLPAELQFIPLFGEGWQFGMGSLLEFLPLAFLALALTLAGYAYVKVYYGVHGAFGKIPMPRMLKPALGALIAGLLTLALYYGSDRNPQTLALLSSGYGIIQGALEPGMQVGVTLLLLIAAGKIVTTSLTIGSGGSGGIFGPAIVIGGCVGAAVGQWLHQVWPAAVPNPGAYVIVGMAGYFAGCANVPISTVIMVSEITGDYKLLIPALWVSAICFLISRDWTIYRSQVPTRLESPAHCGELLVDLLENGYVRDVFDPRREVHRVPESAPLSEIVSLLTRTTQNYFPVVDNRDRLVGVFSANDVRAFTYDSAMWRVTIARDIMVEDVLSVTPDDVLNTALRRFTRRNIDELPVLDPDRPGKVLGMIRRKETIAFYNRRLLDEKRARVEAESGEAAAAQFTDEFETRIDRKT